MKVFQTCIGFLASCHLAIAASTVTINGTVTHSLNINQHPQSLKFLKLDLTPQNKKNIQQSITSELHKPLMKSMSTQYNKLPTHVQLGMNNVPVLNQGSHGTCVTFAVTAALDALIGEDYISQVCALALGNYIAHYSTYRPSGWDGSAASITLARIIEYGIVGKEQQQTMGCGGLTEYPEDGFGSPSNEMSIEEYYAASTASRPFYEGSDFIQSQLLTMEDRLLSQKSLISMEQEVKKALYQGDRILIGTLIPMTNWIGLEGQHHVAHDTWVLTGRTEYLAQTALTSLLSNQWAGHEMIITGYDDQAVAVDSDGKTHRGLFTLRNSWGAEAGDQGSFYMSYDYFRALVLELTRIGNLSL